MSVPYLGTSSSISNSKLPLLILTLVTALSILPELAGASFTNTVSSSKLLFSLNSILIIYLSMGITSSFIFLFIFDKHFQKSKDSDFYSFFFNDKKTSGVLLENKRKIWRLSEMVALTQEAKKEKKKKGKYSAFLMILQISKQFANNFVPGLQY